MTRPLLEGRDTTERLGAEDMAALHAEQLQAAAMLDHQRAVAKSVASTPGVCSNCGDECHPLAIYCDDDCRGDHEARERTLKRQGLRR